MPVTKSKFKFRVRTPESSDHDTEYLEESEGEEESWSRQDQFLEIGLQLLVWKSDFRKLEHLGGGGANSPIIGLIFGNCGSRWRISSSACVIFGNRSHVA